MPLHELLKCVSCFSVKHELATRCGVLQMLQIAVTKQTHCPAFCCYYEREDARRMLASFNGKTVELASCRKRAWLVRVISPSCPKQRNAAVRCLPKTSLSKLEFAPARREPRQ